MIDAADYRGCNTIVYDEKHKAVIAETTIENFEKSTYTVTLRSPAFFNHEYERVSLLIFYRGVPHEYKGTVRKASSGPGTTEIALYKGKVSEKRNAARYPIASKGVINHFIIVQKKVALRVPAEVEVLNISTNGCLLRGSASIMNVNTTFQLSLQMDGAELLINARVVRIKNLDGDTVEYGCKLVFTP